jgi:hypothetical protein
MRRLVESLQRALRGPAGGMLLCLLLAAALGGVAAANPGSGLREAAGSDVPGGQVPSVAPSGTAPETPAGDDQESDDHGGEGAHPTDLHTRAECAATIEQTQSDLTDTDDAHGLAHAITRIDDNCSRIEQAPGLIRALEALTANFQRQLAQEQGRPDDRGDAGQAPSGSAETGESNGEGPPADAGQPFDAGQPAGIANS